MKRSREEESSAVSEAFQDLKDGVLASTWTHPFLRAGVRIPRKSRHYRSPYFLADLHLAGNAHKQLAQLLRSQSEKDTQSRGIVGLVQPFGCGKTKAALALAMEPDMLVVSLQFQASDGFARWLKTTQGAAHKELLRSKGDALKMIDVKNFSDYCLRTTELTVLSVIALYTHCVERGIVDIQSAEDRFLLALLLLLRNEEVDEWLMTWLDENVHFCETELTFSSLKAPLVSRSNVLFSSGPGMKPRRVVVLLDEVHQLMDECKGYTLHNYPPKTDLDPVQCWKRETEMFLPSPGKEQCTDLFHQYGTVMMTNLISPKNHLTFVFCSTSPHSWSRLQSNRFPFRDSLVKFTQLHTFSSANEVWEEIARVLDTPPSTTMSAEVAEKLRCFTRPLFVANLIEELLVSTREEHLCTDFWAWFEAALTRAHDALLEKMSNRVRALASAELPMGYFTSSYFIDVVCLVVKLCGGVCTIRHLNDPLSCLVHEGGVAKFKFSATGDELIITEPIVLKAIQTSVPALNFDRMFEALIFTQSLHNGVITNDHSSKGLLTERVLALIALKEGSFGGDLPCACRQAGTSIELQLPGENEAQRVLASSSREAIVFPSNHAGPDLWSMDKDGAKTNLTCVQSKCVNKIYSLQNLVDALSSLNPARMFTSSTSATLSYWKTCGIPSLRNPNSSYHRVVFSALGFNTHCQYVVHEFNQKFPDMKITLLSLSSIKNKVPPCVLDLLLKKLGKTHKDIASWADNFVEQSELEELLHSAKKPTRRQLEMYCEQRGLPRSSGTMNDLIDRLNTYNLDAECEKLSYQWD